MIPPVRFKFFHLSRKQNQDTGIGLTWLGLRGVESMYTVYRHLVQLDMTLLVTAVGLSVAAAILAGLYPVWRVSRLAPAGLLKTQ